MDDLIIHFNIDTDDVRAFCIRNELYTRGDNRAYEAMFEKCRNGTDIATVKEVVQDILEHSIDGYVFTEAVELFINKCVWISIEA